MEVPASSTEQVEPTGPVSAERIASIDTYRGLVMFLMLAEVLHFSRLHRALPTNPLWAFLAHHQTHVDWTGCSLHDLIQPSFSFLVGVAVPISLAKRRARGQGIARMLIHATWRAFLLVALGIFLRSQHHPQTYFTFEDTLSKIGLGYLPLFLLGMTKVRWQYVACSLLLVSYWLAFVLYPAPGADFDYAAVGVPADWPHHATGLGAHFNLNSNLAWAFDTWFLNLFPRETPFQFNSGGYATLSFLPTLATMILGLIAGEWMKDDSKAAHRLLRLTIAGITCLTLGTMADRFGICPSVKKIWTPAWVFVSGGWCFLLMAIFAAICDVLRWRWWTFPLLVIGANSIVAYVMAHTMESYVVDNLSTHLGGQWRDILGAPFASLVQGAAVLACFYAVLYWLYRQRIYVRI